MNLQSLIVIVLRLLALDFFVRGGLVMTPQLFSAAQANILFAWIIIVGLGIAAALLWFLAAPIGRLVTRGLPQEISFGAMSLIDCYTIAFMAVGLFYIVGNFPQILFWGQYLFMAEGFEGKRPLEGPVLWRQVWQTFIPFVVGVVLFAKGRRWAVTLARRQGIKNDKV